MIRKLFPVLLLIALPVLARLGETRQETEKRFGRPTGTRATYRLHRAGNYLISVHYAKDGKAIREDYRLAGGKLTAEQVDQILAPYGNITKAKTEDVQPYKNLKSGTRVYYDLPRGNKAVWISLTYHDVRAAPDSYLLVMTPDAFRDWQTAILERESPPAF